MLAKVALPPRRVHPQMQQQGIKPLPHAQPTHSEYTSYNTRTEAEGTKDRALVYSTAQGAVMHPATYTSYFVAEHTASLSRWPHLSSALSSSCAVSLLCWIVARFFCHRWLLNTTLAP